MFKHALNPLSFKSFLQDIKYKFLYTNFKREKVYTNTIKPQDTPKSNYDYQACKDVEYTYFY